MMAIAEVLSKDGLQWPNSASACKKRPDAFIVDDSITVLIVSKENNLDRKDALHSVSNRITWSRLVNSSICNPER